MTQPLPPGWTRPVAGGDADELQDAGLAYLHRLASTSDNPILLRAVASVLLAKVQAVEELHHDFHGWCAGCDFAWPCQTTRALAGESRG